MSLQAARSAAEKLAAATTKPPVNVERLAGQLGVPIHLDKLGPTTSGLLVTKGTLAAIFVNSAEPPERQRFTIAHELGHHILQHYAKPGEHVHTDARGLVMQRGPRAAAGIDPVEVAANQFAASLLMPTHLLRPAVAAKSEPITEEEVAELAEEFKVSEQAMTIRLTGLGLL